MSYGTRYLMLDIIDPITSSQLPSQSVHLASCMVTCFWLFCGKNTSLKGKNAKISLELWVKSNLTPAISNLKF